MVTPHSHLPPITDDPASVVTPDVGAGRGISARHPTLTTKKMERGDTVHSVSASNIRPTLHSVENHLLAQAEAGTLPSSAWGSHPSSRRSHQGIWRGSSPAALWQLSQGQPPWGDNYQSLHPHWGTRLVVSLGVQSHFYIKIFTWTNSFSTSYFLTFLQILCYWSSCARVHDQISWRIWRIIGVNACHCQDDLLCISPLKPQGLKLQKRIDASFWCRFWNLKAWLSGHQQSRH